MLIFLEKIKATLTLRVYPHQAAVAVAAAASSIIQCWSMVMLQNGSGTDFQAS